jgi:hypothetical protein
MGFSLSSKLVASVIVLTSQAPEKKNSEDLMTWRIFEVKDKLNDAGWKVVTNIVSAM